MGNKFSLKIATQLSDSESNKDFNLSPTPGQDYH